MSLGVRLKQARLKKKLTQEELAEIVGIKQQAVQRIEAGKVKSTSYVVQLAQALDVTPEWLALGRESTLSGEVDPLVSLANSTKQAPLLQWHETNIIAQLPAVEVHVNKFPLLWQINDKCFALQIKDSSMAASVNGEPSFLKDDYLIIDSSAEPKVGDFVIVKLPDSSQMTFRQLVRNLENGTLQLKALNTQYSTITLTKDMKICGVVLHRYSNFTS